MPDALYSQQTDIDWENLILEVQTDPRGTASDAATQLHLAIYGYLRTVATQWLKQNNLSEAQDDALVAIGLKKVFKEIEKFKPPPTHSEGIGRAFKAWVSKCCKREWQRHPAIERFLTLDPGTIEGSGEGSAPSIEDLLVVEEEAANPDSPRQKNISLKRKILEEELNRLPETMRDAILESEDEKSVDNPYARGKQGLAATIAEKYGYSPAAVRTARRRLVKRVGDRHEKEICS